MDTRHNNLTGPRSHRSQVAWTMSPSPIRRRSQLCRPLRGGQLRRCLDTGSIRWLPRHRCRPPAGAAAFGGAASLPQTPRKRVSPLVLAVVIAVVVVGVALGSFVLAHSIRTPEAEVQRYLDYGDRGAWLYPHCDRC